MKELKSADLSALRHDPTFADLTIVCGDDTHRAHRVIVCAASKWFQAACEPGRFAEGTEAKIVLPVSNIGASMLDGDNPSAISALIDHFYGIDLFLVGSRTNEQCCQLCHSTLIYITADKCGDQDLANRAVHVIGNLVIGFIQRFRSPTSAEHQQGVTLARIRTWLRMVYDNTVSWDISLKTYNLTWITAGDPGMLDHPEIIACIKQIPAFSMDIIRLLRVKANPGFMLKKHNIKDESR
ncbi:Hypothetical protein D9617_2g059820 [Elsinoe fawcettii]|nr:Hypothetical protein D9617_2g059820 [Elsinoe fawcettii]